MPQSDWLKELTRPSRAFCCAQDTFKKADTEGNGRMSFHAFEKFCASCLQAHLDEDQVLDLFDEAIRVTEELTGEETDTVMPEGFARIVREHQEPRVVQQHRMGPVGRGQRAVADPL